MQSKRKALLIFMRCPQPGEVKSRLAAAIGAQEAAAVYEKLVRRTLGVVTDLKRSSPAIKVLVFFTPPERRTQLETHYPGPWQFIPQQGGHLGLRMAAAFDAARARGCEQAVIIGTDIADIEADDLQDAFAALDAGTAVLNPAADGGFYLLGLDRPCPAAFEAKNWGSSEVFARTRGVLRDAGFTVRSFRQRHDIDRPQDLPRLARQPGFRDKLSIVVPTLSPASDLEPLLAALTTGLWPGDEIIVAGPRIAAPGNRQDPLPIADACLGVFSPPGRGVQLNAGARRAKGDLLWFVHDDSIVPAHFAYLVRKLSGAGHMSLGCFELAFSAATPALRAIARWGNWRTRLLKLPYGDQGLFCRRETFDKVGGFHLSQLMEDVDFVRRCRLHGDLLRLPEKLYTSPQRYLERGILRASLRNHLTMLLYHLGWSDERLRAFYYG